MLHAAHQIRCGGLTYLSLISQAKTPRSQRNRIGWYPRVVVDETYTIYDALVSRTIAEDRLQKQEARPHRRIRQRTYLLQFDTVESTRFGLFDTGTGAIWHVQQAERFAQVDVQER